MRILIYQTTNKLPTKNKYVYWRNHTVNFNCDLTYLRQLINVTSAVCFWNQIFKDESPITDI